MNRFNRYWEPSFKGRTLNSITRQDLKEFSLRLAGSSYPPNDENRTVAALKAATVNKIMIVGTTCLSWAFAEGLIPTDPTKGLVGFSGEKKKRGVLTTAEAQALFAKQWKDKRAFTASLLACTTGMRSGEVLAVKREAIEERTLNVRCSWSIFDGLKTPKNGETRRVPLLPEVRGLLLELLNENPHGPDGFVFYGNLADKPVVCDVLLSGLYEALSKIGINAAERGIVFHSWRHYFAARMADRMTADQVSRITGHKSRAVFEEYADHITNENLEEVGKVGAEVFRDILPATCEGFCLGSREK